MQKSAYRIVHGILSRGLRRVGYRLIREDRIPLSSMETLDLGIKVLELAAEPQFVLQIGANDGLRNEPLFPHLPRNWLRGVRVEPLTPVFARLLENTRPFSDRFTCLNMAVADYDGSLDLFIPDDWLNDSTAGEKASASSAHLSKHGVGKRHIAQVTVPCATVREILRITDSKTLDILVIDAEGMDWNICRNVFMQGFKPKMIYLEILHLRPGERYEMRDTFRTRGYQILETTKDCLALQRELLL